MAEESEIVHPEPQQEVEEVLGETTTTEEEVVEEKETQDPPAEEEKAEEKPEEKPKKKGKTAEERIREIAQKTAEMRERERRAIAKEKEIEEREAKLNDTGPPNPDKFDDYDKYNEAMRVYHEKQARIKVEREKKDYLLKEKKQEELKRRMAGWDGRRELAIEANPNYVAAENKVAHRFKSFDNLTAVEEITIDPNGPKIIEYLSNNPEQLLDIADSDQRDTVRKISAISAKMDIKPAKKITKNLKKPITPGDQSGGAPKSVHNMTQREYNIYMNNKRPY